MQVANARMYSATPAAKQAWKEVLGWALERAELPWQVIDHDAPAPLSALWARADLGCALMCGLPYSRRDPRPALIAAHVPAPARYGGRPVYFTDIAVRADAPYRSLEETFGGVIGYTLEDSLSGCVALRAHLLPYRAGHGRALYREALGGLLNARRVIEALREGRIDVGPLDSYFHDLLRAGEPGLAAQVRVIATTRAMPIPPLVATAPLARHERDRLRAALADVAAAPDLSAQRAVLLLGGFAMAREADYNALDEVVEASRRFDDPW